MSRDIYGPFHSPPARPGRFGERREEPLPTGGISRHSLRRPNKPVPALALFPARQEGPPDRNRFRLLGNGHTRAPRFRTLFRIFTGFTIRGHSPTVGRRDKFPQLAITRQTEGNGLYEKNSPRTKGNRSFHAIVSENPFPAEKENPGREPVGPTAGRPINQIDIASRIPEGRERDRNGRPAGSGQRQRLGMPVRTAEVERIRDGIPPLRPDEPVRRERQVDAQRVAFATRRIPAGRKFLVLEQHGEKRSERTESRRVSRQVTTDARQ